MSACSRDTAVVSESTGDEARRAVVVRPSPLRCVLGLSLAAFGAVFTLAGLTDSETRIVMPIFGIFSAGMGIAFATAAATATPVGVRYRYGFVRRWVAGSDIESVDVGPGNGPEYIAIRLNRGAGKPVRLIGVQRRDSEGARKALAEEAARVAAVLGCPAG